MSRSWELCLRDMVDCARKIVRYRGDRSAASFLGDEMARDAVLRNLEILGEAAKGIPPEFRWLHPEVEWRGLAGLRDILAHVYFALDEPTLVRIIDEDVPRLLEQLARMQDDTD